jgi:hypothetical protein
MARSVFLHRALRALRYAIKTTKNQKGWRGVEIF